MHPIAARRPRSRGLTCLFVQGLALAAGLAVSRVPAFAQGDVFSSGSPSTPYGAGNTTRRTGKQAVQDDSVYCQQMPDGRGEHVVVTLEIVLVSNKATEGACEVSGDGGFLGDDQFLAHGVFISPGKWPKCGWPDAQVPRFNLNR